MKPFHKFYSFRHVKIPDGMKQVEVRLEGWAIRLFGLVFSVAKQRVDYK